MRPLLILLVFTFNLFAAEIPAERTEAVRLQVYLDQQNFSPGILDGKVGTYTKKAITAYNKKFGLQENDQETVKARALAAIPNIYATAIVPDLVNDMVDAGFKHGNNRSYQSTRHDMPYRSVAEFMAERYHTSIDFLKLINEPGVVKKATKRSALLVPNVEPFRIENLAAGRTHKKDDILSLRWAVIDTKAHQIRIYEPLETTIPVADTDTELSLESKEIAETPPTDPLPIDGNVARATIVEDDPEPVQQLSAHDEHRALIVAAYPITPGKPQFIRYGTWKMLNAIELPTWRYDASLLQTGQRSNQSLQIPSGPNNPVGIIWMGLSRKGIGIHGTDNPDKIGRGRSAGCIRLANWNAIKLPTMIRPGATGIIN